MQTSFLERHAEDILGPYSCFDRIIIQGTLPDIAHADAIPQWFFTHQLRIFDFPQWAMPYRDRIRSHAEALASKAGLQIEFIRKIDSFRKEDRFAEILAKRGEHPGLVHIFSAMETCHTFQPWHDKLSHRTFFRYYAVIFCQHVHDSENICMILPPLLCCEGLAVCLKKR